jgi:hypothetical protein
MNDLDTSGSPGIDRIYYPEMLSRRGEITVWVLFVIVLLTGLVLKLNGRAVPYAVAFLGLFFLLAGLAVSLGNWMDRRTFIKLTPGSIEFSNGLRHVELEWQEIDQLEVYPSKWGDKVHVRGPESHFAFRTMGEVKMNQEVKGRMGFEEGDKILEVLVERSKLRKVEQSEPGEYYVR